MAEDIYIEKKFNDFAESTDYYYEELGKLSQVPEISKREKKKIKKIIKDSMFASFKVLRAEERQINDMAKTMDKECYDAFKDSRNKKQGIFSKVKQLFHKQKNIEVLGAEEVKVIENINSSEDIISSDDNNINSKTLKNFNSAKSENAKGVGGAPASHDDEPMKF